jgi:hypothetical protein
MSLTFCLGTDPMQKKKISTYIHLILAQNQRSVPSIGNIEKSM